jgi:hypothetical protein
VLEQTPGIARIYAGEQRREIHLDHPRAGEIIALAKPDAWFTYYYWMEDARAPDFARTVDIHRKPGYDPAELFLSGSRARASWTLLKRKLGFRSLLKTTPLDAAMVMGSHGLPASSQATSPVLISNRRELVPQSLAGTEVAATILRHVFE